MRRAAVCSILLAMCTESREVDTFVIMLCGIPGSGKSTVAAELVRRLGDVEIIATDVIGGRGGRYRKLRERLQRLADRRRFVILDGTFFVRAVREGIREMGHPVLLAHLKCPVEVCLERNRGRRDAIPEKGVLAMRLRFEEPGADEAPLLIRTDKIDPGTAAKRIHRAVADRLQRGAGGGGGREPGESGGGA